MIINLSRTQTENEAIFKWEWSTRLASCDGEAVQVMKHCLLFSHAVNNWFRDAGITIPEIQTTESLNKYTYAIVFKHPEDAILFKTTWL